MNKGPELFVKVIKWFASSNVILFDFSRSAVVFAPIGYPLVIPKTSAIEDIPGSLKRGCIIGLRIRPIIVFIPVILRSSLKTRKENKEGKIIFAHSRREFLVEDRIVVGEMIINTVHIRIKIEKSM